MMMGSWATAARWRVTASEPPLDGRGQHSCCCRMQVAACCWPGSLLIIMHHTSSCITLADEHVTQADQALNKHCMQERGAPEDKGDREGTPDAAAPSPPPQPRGHHPMSSTPMAPSPDASISWSRRARALGFAGTFDVLNVLQRKGSKKETPSDCM